MRRRGTVSPARPLSIWGAALCGVVAYALLGLGTATADSCPNAAIRDDQGTTDLPECRAFEQVTPVEKNEANVSLGKPAQSAEQPGAVAFTTSTGLPGGQTNLSIGYYRAKRGIEGWTTSFYDLPQQNQGTSIVQATRFISSDLTKSVSASQSPLLGITPGGAAVFVHDLESGGATPIAEEPSDVRLEPNWLYTDFLDVSFGPVFGATPDLSQLVFQGRSAFPGDAAPAGVFNVWEWHNGQLGLVNILPNGEPSPTGAALWGGTSSQARQNPGWLSADGSRAFFVVPPAAYVQWGVLYVRKDGMSTRLISYSQRTGDDPSVPADVEFVAATPDGRFIFFETRTPLTDDSVDTGNWLYRYDLETDHLIKVAGTGGGLFSASNQKVQRVSVDGERVYFTTPDPQTPEATPGEPDLYLWDHGQTRLISREQDEPRAFAMSDNGRFMEFTTLFSPTGYTGTSPACPNEAAEPGPCQEIYAYDALTEETTCLSCPPQGVVPAGDASTGVVDKGVAVYTPRAVLNDGTYLFDTPTALVPEDTNRKRDVYEWKDGTLSLISSGVDRNDARYLDASPDGTDVYFATVGRLVAQDRDNLRDIYTARRDGGIASQNAPRAENGNCNQEVCQGQPSTPGPASTIGSGVVTGPAAPSRRGSGHARRTRLTVRTRGATAAAATLAVTVTGPGTIEARGRGVLAAAKRVGGAGTETIQVRLTKAARPRNGEAKRVKVKVTFTPREGRPSSRQLSVRFGPKGGSR